MYKIIGTDGRQYGPVSADQIRQWLAQNRANMQSMAQAEGAIDWKPLSLFPEFASDIKPAPPAVSASANSHADPWSALPIPVLPEIDINRSEGLLDDTDNGGIRREPTLPGHEAIEPEPATTAREFAMLEDDSDDDTARARVLLRGTSSSIARQVAMDPGDGMDL